MSGVETVADVPKAELHVHLEGSHPFPQLLGAGLALTINSDDPAMFGTTLDDELRLVHDTWGVPLESIESMIETAFEAACDPAAAKAARG